MAIYVAKLENWIKDRLKIHSVLFLHQVHKNLGLDQAKMLFTAAAPISKSTCEYFQSLNLPLNEVYGMSESAGMMTMCTSEFPRITSIGRVCRINTVRIANADEDGSGEVGIVPKI